jgi:hypothetical protein
MSERRSSGVAGLLDRAPTAASYAMYGLRVRSEVPLPIAALPTTDEAACDWLIQRAGALRPIPVPDAHPIAEDRSPDGALLDRFFRVGRDAWLWDAQAGTCHLEPWARRVTVYPAPDADEDDLGLLLLGPISSFMLHRTGTPNLHASAVVTPSGACAVLGPSTLGKSTLAAGLLRAGARLLTDDILPLDLRPDAIYGVPGAPMMKLWPATACRTLGIVEELPRLTCDTQKRRLDLHRHAYPFMDRPAPLRAIYLPCRYDPRREGRTDVVVEPFGMRDAVLTLLGQTFRGHYLLPHELADLLRVYTRLAREVRVARLHLPNGLEHIDTAVERIIEEQVAA